MTLKATALHKFAPAAELGPADDYPPGSAEWAIRISNRLQIAASSLSSHSVLHLKNTVKAIWEAQPPPWEIFPEGKPYGTPDDYCLAITGHSWEFLVGMIKEFSGDADLSTEKMRATLARAQIEHRSQGTRTDLLNDRVTKLATGSNVGSHLLRRLARNHPKILDAYERGEFKSVLAAARAAGIRKEHPSVLERIKRLYIKKLDAADRVEFLRWAKSLKE